MGACDVCVCVGVGGYCYLKYIIRYDGYPILRFIYLTKRIHFFTFWDFPQILIKLILENYFHIFKHFGGNEHSATDGFRPQNIIQIYNFIMTLCLIYSSLKEYTSTL